MNFKKYLLGGFCFLFFCEIKAQNENDAVRYSFQTLGSSARAYSLGGAIGAVGADYGSAGVNPSGMARFRSSQFYIATSFHTTRNNSYYIDKELSDKKFNFNIPNFGFVINKPLDDFNNKKPKGLVNVVFGFNLNRNNNFHRKTIFNANNNSSISQNWAERADANNTTPNEFSRYSLEWLAFESWMIDADTNSSVPKYISAYGTNGINVNQKGIIQNSGGITDYNFSLSTNYKQLLLIGASIGFKSARFVENNNFTEVDNKTVNIRDIQSVTLDQYIKTSGSGFNAKLGFTFCPTDFLRIGYAFHSPTVFNLTDSYSYTINSKFDNGALNPFGFTRKNSFQSTESVLYKYIITTPSMNVLSLALVSKEVGFISVDLDFVNYSSAGIRPKDPTEEPFVNENIKIKSLLKNNAVNFKIGGEYIYEDFRFRAGYAKYSSIYRDNAVPFSKDLGRNFYSFGVGIKKENYSIDFAYVNGSYSDYTVPYSLNNLGTSQKNYTMTNNVRTSNIVISLGVKLD